MEQAKLLMTMEGPQKTQIAEVQDLREQISLLIEQVAVLCQNPKATSKCSVIQVSAAWLHKMKLSINRGYYICCQSGHIAKQCQGGPSTEVVIRPQLLKLKRGIHCS